MEKEFVNYEIALILKEKGFMEECFGFYYYDGSFEKYRLVYEESSNDYLNSINAPLWQQVIDWLRTEHNKVINLHLWDREDKESWKYEVTEYGEYEMHFQTKNPKIKCSYEQARKTAIEETLTLIRLNITWV